MELSQFKVDKSPCRLHNEKYYDKIEMIQHKIETLVLLNKNMCYHLPVLTY